MNTTEKQRRIYDRHEKATAGIEAFCLMDGEQLIGRLTIRGRATNQGRTVRAWLHVLGIPMVEGVANGGGYDMASAAVEDAAGKLPNISSSVDEASAATIENLAKIRKAFTGIGGGRYDNLKPGAGFSMFRAI